MFDEFLILSTRIAPEIDTVNAGQRGRHGAFPVPTSYYWDEFVTTDLLEDFTRDNMALVASSSLAVIKPLFVFLSANNEDKTPFPDGALHKFWTTCTQQKVGLVDDRVDAIVS
jgi:hypothetical protein